jgi:ankyrin repeat protein
MLMDFNTLQLNNQNESLPQWKAKITPLFDNSSDYTTLIGQLEIFSTNKSNEFKTLVIPVINISRSMKENLIKAKYSLQRILDMTYKYSTMITSIVTYSETATDLIINKDLPIEYYQNIINQIDVASYDTSLISAFHKILKIVKSFSNDLTINSVVIVFLTDGEELYDYKTNKKQLANVLKYDMDKIWTKHWVIHTVGFGFSNIGFSCNFGFLNNLRMIGKEEGVYRYTYPSEDVDSLSNKINSLVNIIAESSFVPIEFLATDNSIPIISGSNYKYWINLTGLSLAELNQWTYRLKINNQIELTINVEFTEETPINIQDIWSQWYSYLIDQIANELIGLINCSSKLHEKQLQCELLLARSRSILVKLESKSVNFERLTILVNNINLVLMGEQKLNNIKFEGKIATNKSINSTVPYANSIPTQNIRYGISSQLKYNNNLWVKIQRNHINRWDKTFSQLADSNIKAKQWIDSNLIQLITQVDSNGSNVLEVASSIGRIELVEYIWNKSLVELTHTNKYGYNALDMALIYGYWKTSEYLFDQGFKPNFNPNKIFQSNLLFKHFITAELLINNKLVVVDQSFIEQSPNAKVASWLSTKSTINVSIEVAIYKGMYEIVEKKIDHIDEQLSWEPYLELLAKPTKEQFEIIELLLANSKLNPNEEIIITVYNANSQPEKEVVWPLFIACEKGNIKLFRLLMMYWDSSTINKQNLKGTTCLWIACYNGHFDIVCELLSENANFNICNNKGDSPLIPCCQKGLKNIVKVLLQFKILLYAYNKNGYNPFLICCRNGQAEILELLFASLYYTKFYLETYAEIDGFVPLLAATKLDNIECIKVCLKFGADIEAKTLDSNKIIQGATALHLACFYGHLSSVKVLLDSGSNILARTNVYGWTPLHIAIKQGHVSIVKLLLTYPNGENALDIDDNDGRKPIYYANIIGNELIKEES